MAGQVLDGLYRKFLIYDDTTKALGNLIQADLANVPATLADLYGYIDFFEVKISGTMKQSAATAVLTMEQIRGIMSDAKWWMNGHEFAKAMPGNHIHIQQILDTLFMGGNVTGLITADFANNTDDTALDIRYRIPVGRNPLKLFGERGGISFTLLASGWGDWAVKAGTTLTVRIFAHCHYQPGKLLPRPYLLDRVATTDATIKSNMKLGKMDMAVVLDGDTDVPGSYTRPTAANITVDADERCLFDKMSCAELEYASLVGRANELADFFDQGALAVISPAGLRVNKFVYPNEDMLEFPYVDQLKVYGAGDGGKMCLLTRRWIDPSETMMALWAGAMGLPSWSQEAKSRLHIDGVPVNAGKNALLTQYQKAGMQRELV